MQHCFKFNHASLDFHPPLCAGPPQPMFLCPSLCVPLHHAPLPTPHPCAHMRSSKSFKPIQPRLSQESAPTGTTFKLPLFPHVFFLCQRQREPLHGTCHSSNSALPGCEIPAPHNYRDAKSRHLKTTGRNPAFQPGILGRVWGWQGGGHIYRKNLKHRLGLAPQKLVHCASL